MIKINFTVDGTDSILEDSAISEELDEDVLDDVSFFEFKNNKKQNRLFKK